MTRGNSFEAPAGGRRTAVLRIGQATAVVVLLFVALPGSRSKPAEAKATASVASPIQHVVVIFQENHSFDNMLGKLCVVDARCDGTVTGTIESDKVIPLSQATDIVPIVSHSVRGQRNAIEDGSMDGFSLLSGCTKLTGYACYSQADPSQLPNLSALARAFVISDRTFEFRSTPSWVGHIALVAASVDGFQGDNPIGGTRGGWGCDTTKKALWLGPNGRQKVPTCIPDKLGNGPFEPSPVKYVPTIWDSLDAAGLPWRLYSPQQSPRANGYEWAICPTFFECLGGPQKSNMVRSDQVLTDARNGALPNFSIVIPGYKNSQHNSFTLAGGDNWIGKVVSAIQSGPDWASTAIFVTYDDCGCFYDHVAPPVGEGIRVPMVIVSPWAKPGFTDSTDATFTSILAFVEHTFALPPLNNRDATAYDYANSFSFSQDPLAPVHMVQRRIPAWEARWVDLHGESGDPT